MSKPIAMGDATRIAYFASKAAYEESRTPSLTYEARTKLCSPTDALTLDSVIKNPFHGIEVMVYRHRWIISPPRFGQEGNYTHASSIVVAFRGSEFRFNDWFNNLRFFPTAYGWHRGWTFGYESIRDELLKRVNLLKESIENNSGDTVPVIGTGHSRGGSFTKIGYLYEDIPLCITFGAPAVAEHGTGNGISPHYFRKCIANARAIDGKQKVRTAVHIATEKDIVPYLTSPFGYKASSYILLPSGIKGHFVTQHRLPAYRSAIEQLGVFNYDNTTV